MSSSPSNKRPNLDSVTTINQDGSRFTLHPADVKGRFTLSRRLVGWAILAVFFILPWIKIPSGDTWHPAVFFDIDKLRYYFFGLQISVQDLWVFFFIITGVGFALFFVTALLGRVWCGWTCPYTLLNEHVFRRIERLIEGDAPARRKLDAAPMSFGKFFKRSLKWGIYLFIATAVSHTFFAYFQSTDRMSNFMSTGPSENMTLFLMVWSLTGILLFSFGWFREQFCIVMCPYGRLQSAMTDDDSVIVGYDEHRGEPRGKAKDPNAGDCINCKRCVQVCPTGIDIRNGLQLECIGCAACIDACDDIMTKLKRPKGLIRYDSYNGLERNKRRWLRPRIFIYAILGLIGLVAFGIAFKTQARSFNAQVTRVQGSPYAIGENSIRNLAQLRLVNKRSNEVSFSVTLIDPPEGLNLLISEESLTLSSEQEEVLRFTLVQDAEHWKGPFEITIEVRSLEDDNTMLKKFEFLGPSRSFFKRRAKKEAPAEKAAAEKETPDTE